MIRTTLYNEWTKDNIADWEIRLLKGKLHFLIFSGLLKTGGIMFVLCTGLFYFFMPERSFSSPVSILLTLLINASGFGLVGLVYAHYFWEQTTQDFARLNGKANADGS